MTSTRTVAADLEQFHRDGFVIAERAIDEEALERIRRELAPWLDESAHKGRNDFEGFSTNRVSALLAKAPSVAELVEHPWVIAMLDELLLPNYLLSANLAINLLPGETAQNLHTDDSFYPVPRPRAPISISTVWAIDDFTATNGATEIIARSHRWGDERPPADHPDLRAVEMPAGSVVLFAGTLWHRGGGNRSDRPRLAITPQYCEPWARQQEQHALALGPGAARYSDRVKAMVGYSIHPPFMGHVDGLHPRRLLDDGYDARTSDAGRIAADVLTAQPGGDAGS
ncbi:MAG: phytanoyl-CoA dioxygenase family protein [Actinomycetota bacterium]|nr:phytanoyl-CoA dioxygenase family protein [Actinomycetota bacterium]